MHSGKPELRHHQQSFLPQTSLVLSVTQTSLVLSATGSLELRLVSSAILEYTNNNTSQSWLGLVIVSNDRRTTKRVRIFSARFMMWFVQCNVKIFRPIFTAAVKICYSASTLNWDISIFRELKSVIIDFRMTIHCGKPLHHSLAWLTAMNNHESLEGVPKYLSPPISNRQSYFHKNYYSLDCLSWIVKSHIT